MGRLLQYDALEQSWRELRLRRDPACPMCSDHPTITGLIDYDELNGVSVADAVAWATEQDSPVTLYLYDQGKGTEVAGHFHSQGVRFPDEQTS